MARDGIFQDWAVNRSVGFKSRIVLAFFRLAQTVGAWPPPLAPVKVPVILAYRILTEWILGIDLSWTTSVGPRLRLFHGQGLVVHPASVIGADCILRHSTTLGTRDYPEQPTDDAPVVGDGVDVGAHVVILGPIRVGDRVAIGAGSVVVSDVPDDSIVVGNPARVIGVNEHPVIPRPAPRAALDAGPVEA